MDLTAFGFSILSALGFALYVIPRKISKQDNISFAFWMSVVFAASSFVIFIIKQMHQPERITFGIISLSAVTGIIWAIAFLALIKSIQLIGLVKSNMWKNVDGALGTFLPLIVLAEYKQVNLL